nr:phosphate-starvation-inducible PsiE family protein [uncultured Methanoregula sp.]
MVEYTKLFEEIIDRFEKIVYAVIIIMLIVVLLGAMYELVQLMKLYLLDETPLVLVSSEVIGLLGAFLLVLIVVELLDTIKAYFKENKIHVEIVILLAIIAVARKVLLLDRTGISPSEYNFELISVGVIVLCLTAGYYLVKRAGITVGPDGIQRSG